MLIDTVELARKLIRFDTASAPGQQGACLELLESLFRGAGFAVHRDEFAPGQCNLLAKLPEGGGPGLCFGGHIDTVRADGAPWAYAPFSAEIHAGDLYGRGSCDMKSGVAAVVSAALALAPGLKAAGRDLAVEIYGGEEAGCRGSFHAQENALFSLKPAGLIIAEPSNNRILSGHKGALWLEISAYGKAAHGSMPQNGENALAAAVRAAEALSRLTFEQYTHEELGAPTLSLTGMRAGRNVNTIPDKASFTVDIRTVPSFGSKSALGRVTSVLGRNFGIRKLLDIPPVWTDPETPWVRRSKELLAERTGVRNPPESVQFFTDAAAVRRSHPEVPVIILGPGDPNQVHRTDEHCPVEQIRTARELYLDIAADWYGLDRESLAAEAA